MNLSEIGIIGEDEILRGSRNKYTLSGFFIFLFVVINHYSTSILSLFSFKSNADIPFYLISYFIILFLGPFLIMMASFDIISNEVEIDSIRYIVSKIDRASFVLGKFLALFIVFVFALFAITIINLFYTYFSNNTIQLGTAVLFWGFSSLYLGCFITIFLFISALSENNRTSLIMSIVFLGILFFLLIQGNDSFLKYFTPFSYGINNIGFFGKSTHVIDFYALFKNTFAMIIYEIIFLSMSLFAIKRRDL